MVHVPELRHRQSLTCERLVSIAHWSQALFALGTIAMLAGAWYLSNPLSLLGVALMVPMMALVFIYVRNCK